MGREGHPQFDQGDLKQIPCPAISSTVAARLKELALLGLSLRKRTIACSETSVYFGLPILLQQDGETLKERIQQSRRFREATEAELSVIQEDIDSLAYRLFAIRSNEQQAIEEAGIPLAVEAEDSDDTLPQYDEQSDDSDEGAARWGAEIVSYCIGCAFGRWDIRFARGDQPIPPLPAPFESLPTCSRGMLKAASSGHGDSLSSYPIDISWDGVLVDTPGNSQDIVGKARNALDVIWKEKADAIENELCEILGVKQLRDFFRKPGNGGCWDQHIRRYSKSRRKAPIYWLLQSLKKNYALWLYYHRLDKDILFKALVNHVEPKIRLEENRLAGMRGQKGPQGESGKEAKKLAKEIEKQEDFLSELRDFENKLRRAANLHLEPDLNDGVVLNIAPLWELVPWRDAKDHWHELMEGKYEWSSIGKQLREKGLVK